MECPNDKYSKLKIYISELTLESCDYMPVEYVTILCMTLPKLNKLLFASCVYGFLIRNSNDHSKETHSQLKNVRYYFYQNNIL
jgi:hypothetical protein